MVSFRPSARGARYSERRKGAAVEKIRRFKTKIFSGTARVDCTKTVLICCYKSSHELQMWSWVWVREEQPKIPFTKVGGIFTSYFLPLHSYLKIKFSRDFWEVSSIR